MEFNVQQLLFEVFSHIMRIFDSVEPLSKSTFPFLYIKWQSLEPPNSTPGEIDICAHRLLWMEFNVQQLLFEVFSHTYNAYF